MTPTSRDHLSFIRRPARDTCPRIAVSDDCAMFRRGLGAGSCYREQNCSLNCNLSSGTASTETKRPKTEAIFPTRSSFRFRTSRKIIRATKGDREVGRPFSGKRRQLYSQPSVSVSASSHVRSPERTPTTVFAHAIARVRAARRALIPRAWNFLSASEECAVPAAFSRAQPFRERARGASRDRATK